MNQTPNPYSPRFRTHPGLVPLADGVNWKLEGKLEFFDHGTTLTAPKGFETDLASIPALGLLGGSVMLAGSLLQLLSAWALVLTVVGFLICWASKYLKAYGRYTFSAVLHDWLYRTHALGFTESNWILLVAMKAERTALWERFLIWFNVQAFGWWIYHNDKRRIKLTHHHS